MFKNQTVLIYNIAVTGKVSLKLYDITEKCIKTLVDEIKGTGYYEVGLKTKDYVSGVYFAKLVAEECKETKKLIFVKN